MLHLWWNNFFFTKVKYNSCDQEQLCWAPYLYCNSCGANLRQWQNGKTQSLLKFLDSASKNKQESTVFVSEANNFWKVVDQCHYTHLSAIWYILFILDRNIWVIPIILYFGVTKVVYVTITQYIWVFCHLFMAKTV